MIAFAVARKGRPRMTGSTLLDLYGLCLHNDQINGVNEFPDLYENICNLPLGNLYRSVSQLYSNSGWTEIAQPELLIHRKGKQIDAGS